jgi:hypothetical protein
MNSFIRRRLALTESEPAIRPYDQALWAELPDMSTAPVEISLQLIEALHTRWVVMLRGLAPATGCFVIPRSGWSDWTRTLPFTLPRKAPCRPHYRPA